MKAQKSEKNMINLDYITCQREIENFFTDVSLENSLRCLNTKFQKNYRETVDLHTHE